MPFNPFDKPIGSRLGADDLQGLVQHQVGEGYVVEFKGATFSSAAKISHSIASFANTLGGWYVVGVETGSDHTARNVCGFSLTDYPDPVATVREIAKYHIDPVPVLYPQPIDLGPDRAGLVVYIPGEQETPFITRDGRIYRRLHDSSDPVSALDRHALDRLVDNGRNVVNRFQEFCRDERAYWDLDERSGVVSLFFSPYPLGMIEREHLISGAAIKDLIERRHHAVLFPPKFKGWVDLDTAQPTTNSVILQARRQDPNPMKWLSAELFVDGRAKFHIPLAYLADTSEDGLRPSVRSRAATDGLLRNYRAEASPETWDPQVFRINELWRTVGALVGYYLSWLGEDLERSELQVAMQADGIRRSLPFMDSDAWGHYVSDHGRPIMTRDAVEVPPGIGRGLRFTEDEKEQIWLRLCKLLGLAFGLPAEIHDRLLQEMQDREL